MHLTLRTDTFLQINDQINTVIARYQAFKKGDYSFASNPVPSHHASANGAGSSLIDFDDPQPPLTSNGGAIGLDDLNDLFGGLGTTAPHPPAQPQAPRAPYTPSTYAPKPQTQTQPPVQPQPHAGYGMSMLLGETNTFQRPASSSSSRNGLGAGIALPGTPGGTAKPQAATPQPPTYFAAPNFGGQVQLPGANSSMGLGLGQGQPQAQASQPPPRQQPTQQQPPKANDPFGDLAGLF